MGGVWDSRGEGGEGHDDGGGGGWNISGINVKAIAMLNARGVGAESSIWANTMLLLSCMLKDDTWDPLRKLYFVFNNVWVRFI